MSQYKVAFLGTPDFAVPCLQKLIDDSHFDVVGVVTQPDRPAGRNMKIQMSPVKELALKNNIPVVTPEKIVQALDQIREWQAETAAVVAFGQILPKSFLELYQHRVVNVHASILPRWRGAAPIQRAIMEGDTETGVSLQVVVSKLDAGPVLGIRKFAIDPDMRSPQLYGHLKELGPELLAAEYADWLRGMLPPRDQDETQVTLAPKIKKEEGLIDWRLPADKIYNQFRGLFGWPGSFIVRSGKQLKIKNCKPLVDAVKATPGTVTDVGPQSFKVACGSGQIEILNVQPESKSEVAVSEYLKGYPLKKGESL
jgi:methionyl-tRNA formyltransferase